jgi:hypothetical protein
MVEDVPQDDRDITEKCAGAGSRVDLGAGQKNPPCVCVDDPEAFF